MGTHHTLSSITLIRLIGIDLPADQCRTNSKPQTLPIPLYMPSPIHIERPEASSTGDTGLHQSDHPLSRHLQVNPFLRQG